LPPKKAHRSSSRKKLSGSDSMNAQLIREKQFDIR
jgi:hypothetical protein